MRGGWILALTLGATLGGPAPTAAQSAPVRIGVVSGPLGSFASTILTATRIPFEPITAKVPGDSLGRFGLVVIDNLYRLQDLNAPAFKSYVERGGVLVILNPKTDGFTKSWSPYEIFIGEFTLEAKIVQRKHPLFRGFPNDKLQDFADSNGPFVGNCSFTEPAPEWKVLARHAKKSKNAVIVEADYGKGHLLLACTRFDHYNAKPGPTRLGDNLFKYLIELAAARAG